MKTKLITNLLMGFLTSFFGYAQKTETSLHSLKDILVVYNKDDGDDGFKDINLSITEQTKSGDIIIYVAKGLFEGKVVGLQFEIKRILPAGINNEGIDQNGFVKNALTIKSIGPESDEFLKAISTIYGLSVDKKIKNVIPVATIFSLNTTAVDLDKNDHYKFKAFLEEEDGSNYCEVFFNINTIQKTIELHEKDQVYRKLIISALSISEK